MLTWKCKLQCDECVSCFSSCQFPGDGAAWLASGDRRHRADAGEMWRQVIDFILSNRAVSCVGNDTWVWFLEKLLDTCAAPCSSHCVACGRIRISALVVFVTSIRLRLSFISCFHTLKIHSSLFFGANISCFFQLASCVLHCMYYNMHVQYNM